jgi:Tfp pilus assembly protein FimT
VERNTKIRASGFTLIELLLVVSLMMIAVAFVTVRIDLLLPSTRMEGMARVLAADLGNARASAIAQGLPYAVEYDVRNSSYRIVTPYKPDGGVATDEVNRVFLPWTKFPEGVTVKEVIIGNTYIRDGIRRIELKPNGNTIEHTVHLVRDLPESHFYLAVQGLTGFVQFHRGEDWSPEIVNESDFP